MRIGLLGPLELADDAGAAVWLPGSRLRVLLAALALNAGTPVAADRLAEFVWSGTPPSGYATTLRSHVMRLRRALPAARIEAGGAGYALSAVDLRLDVFEFEKLCRQAAAAEYAESWTEAADAASAALGLWRAEPLVDVPSQVLGEIWVPRLERQRVQVLEDWIEAQLQLGRHEPVLEQLRELTARYPLRERFHAQLLRALARSGRRAEALAAYLDARRTLVDELGVEPGPELRRLHERILAGDDDLSAPDTPSAGPGTEPRPSEASEASGAPRQLPAAAGYFIGRQRELDELTGLIEAPRQAESLSGTVVISAIDGMAGIGKTALAVHAAHRLAEQFPGGQLFVDLHGYTRGHPPREPGQALEALLRALGVPAGRIPADTEERSALFRQRLADTRTLILLDNARDEAQVRPLLPGGPGCLVLVTSRRRLKGLDDAHCLSLDLLPLPDAVGLLRAVVGADRCAADDPLAREIAELCGRLPLAVRIAGALLRHRPAWTLDYLAGLLRDQQGRLSHLRDGERDLASAFDLSYAGLGEEHRSLFRRLGLVPGSGIDGYAAAALLGADPSAVTRLLEDLVDHNLLIAGSPGRYQLHDLLRAHARALAPEEPAAERTAAVDRLLRYYAHTAQQASVSISRHPRPAPHIAGPAYSPALPDPEAARTWLRVERDDIEAARLLAASLDLPGHAVALAAGLAEIMHIDGPAATALAMHSGSAEAAERYGDRAAQATALTDLGRVRRVTGDPPGAEESLSRALEICREIGHRHGEAAALADLGYVWSTSGNLPGAEKAMTQALEIYREIGNRHGQAATSAELGHVRSMAGELGGGDTALTQALEIYREIGHQLGQAYALTELGRLRQLTGDLPAAADAISSSLGIYQAIGNRHGQAYALIELGRVLRGTGELGRAEDALIQARDMSRRTGNRDGDAIALVEFGRLRQAMGDPAGADAALAEALEIFRATGNSNNEAWALNHHAAALAAAGDLPRALGLYQRAQTMNRELGKPDDEAISHAGLGECHLAAGEKAAAVAELRAALAIFERLGMLADADRTRARLAALD